MLFAASVEVITSLLHHLPTICRRFNSVFFLSLKKAVETFGDMLKNPNSSQ